MDEFLAFLRAKGLELYQGQKRGTLLIRVSLPERRTTSERPTALVTEHRAYYSNQHRLTFDYGPEAAALLPTGEYSLLVSAPGCAPHRSFAIVTDGQITTVDAKLREQTVSKQSFDQLLEKNFITHGNRKIGSLSVGEGEHLVLDAASREHHAHLHTVTLRSVHDVKQVLGTPDSAFVGNHPRFGNLLDERRSRNNGQTSDIQMRAAMMEFVYGNSKSAAKWEGRLNEDIARNPINFGVFVLKDVDVGPRATLDVTAGGLLCNTLSVHYSGKVLYRGAGPGKVEMNHWLQYGIIDWIGSTINRASWLASIYA